MTPNPYTLVQTGVLTENEEEISVPNLPKEVFKPQDVKPQYVLRNIVCLIIFHGIALYGLYLVLTSARIYTTLFAVLCYQCSVIGALAGAHRLWSHRSFKANRPLTILLMLMNSMAYQGSGIHWARDHRVHHKFSETDADPHNAKRGFFFSQIGWTLERKHPLVKEQGNKIDISDLTSDPILAFQHKYYNTLMLPLMCFVVPIMVPVYFWEETFVNAFCVNFSRIILSQHGTSLINSVAHLYGNKPYDKHINPTENLWVSLTSLGEGWHNYHHTFPWDYKASEYGRHSLNISMWFIDFFAMIGWATDLKTVSKEMIQRRVDRTGDGSRAIWGWGDKDQPKEDLHHAIVTHRRKL